MCWVLRNFKDFKGKILTTFIIVFHLIYPTITKGVFSIFNCIEFEGELKVMQDTSQVCSGKTHWYYVTNASIPSIIMWVIALPLGALWLLFRHGKFLERIEKLDLSKEEIQKLEKIGKKYRFLYSGFHANYFYWEIMIIFRKVAMIAAGVFLTMASAPL